MTTDPKLPSGPVAQPFDARTAGRADYRTARDELVAASRRRTMQPTPVQDVLAAVSAPTGAELGTTSAGASTPAVAMKPERVPALNLPAAEYASALAKAVPGYRRR